MCWNSPLTRVLALLSVFGAIFVGLQLAGYHPPPREVGRPTKEQIEQDLQLRLELHPDFQSVPAGGYLLVKAKLVNTSRTRTHFVVKPGAGSEIAFREPHVYWTATLDRDGERSPVPKEFVGYCGNEMFFMSFGEKDWVTLRPGGVLVLDHHSIDPRFEFQQAGRVRLQAHYDFRGDRNGFPRLVPEKPSPFADVPAFTLSSVPIEFDVVRPLDVRVEVKGTLKARQRTRLSDLLSITVVNQSNDPIVCSMPTLHSPGSRVFLELRGEFGWIPSITDQRAVYADENVPLKPHEEVPLIGKGDFANGLDGFWEYPKKGTVQLRAGYSPKSREYAPTVWSDWVEVQVIE